jgi:hypothetical protein
MFDPRIYNTIVEDLLQKGEKIIQKKKGDELMFENKNVSSFLYFIVSLIYSQQGKKKKITLRRDEYLKI